MIVSELPGLLEHDNVRYEQMSLGDISIEGRRMLTPTVEYDFAQDPDSMAALAQYFKIPAAFMKRLPDHLVHDTFGYFLEGRDEDVILTHDSISLHNVFDVGVGIIDNARFVEVITNVMKPTDRVTRSWFQRGKVHIDVLSAELQTEARVGDYTRAGVRLTGHISPVVQEPEVGTFLERLVCGNGMTVTELDGIIPIAGSTIEEIVDEMEAAAARVLAHASARLDQWKSLTELGVDNVDQMVHRLATENGISAQVERSILERTPGIDGHTLYDVVNLMTGLQTEDISQLQVERLQRMAGEVIATRGAHRCPSCAHLLA